MNAEIDYKTNPYIRAPHGGRLYNYAEACDASIIDKSSRLYDNVQVFNSEVINSRISEDCHISEAVIKNSIVRGNAIISNAEIENCIVDGNVKITGKEEYLQALAGKSVRIKNTNIFGETVVAGSAQINDCELRGQARVFGLAEIKNCRVKDASIYGTAEVLGKAEAKIVLDGFYRIGGGVWHRAPRFFRFEDLGVSVTEGAGDLVYVACIPNGVGYWLEHGHLFGKLHGWNDRQVEMVLNLLREWKENPGG